MINLLDCSIGALFSSPLSASASKRMRSIADMEVKPQEEVVSSNNSKQDGIKDFGNVDHEELELSPDTVQALTIAVCTVW